MQLGIEHGGGDFCVLHGEGSAEAAAAFEVREGKQFESADFAEQAKWPVAYMQSAKAVATGVIGDAMRKICADVVDAEFVGEEFA